jgi:tetratricopeptide (TPR) repeat protein
MAGDRALRLDAVRAVTYYEKALALMSREDPDRPQVLIKAGLSRADVGDPDQPPVPMWEEAAELARDNGDALAAGRALRLIHLAHWYSSGSGIGTKELDEAIELLEAEPPSPELAEAYTTRAGYHMVAGDLDEQLLWSERAVELDESLGTGTGKPFSIRGIARFHLGDIEGGMEDLLLALEIAESEHVPNHVVSTAYVNLAGHTWLEQGPVPALDVYRAGIDKLEPRGTDMSWSWAETMWPDFDLGEWDRLLATAGKLLEKWDGQDVQFVPWAQSSQAKVLTWRGDVKGASELYERCMPRLREIEDLQMLTPALASSARAWLAKGDESEALVLIDEFFSRTEGKSPLYRAIQVTDMVRLLVSLAELERARAWCDGSAAPSQRCEIGLRHAEAILAEAEGDIESAVTGYLDVADRWSGYGYVLEHALALHGGGRCLLALGETNRAGPQISSARDMLLGLGATPFVEQIDGVSDQVAVL